MFIRQITQFKMMIFIFWWFDFVALKKKNLVINDKESHLIRPLNRLIHSETAEQTAGASPASHRLKGSHISSRGSCILIGLKFQVLVWQNSRITWQQPSSASDGAKRVSVNRRPPRPRRCGRPAEQTLTWEPSSRWTSQTHSQCLMGNFLP